MRNHTVIGANGTVGRETVAALLRRGDSVTAVGRSASTTEGVTAVVADALDAASLRSALAGADVATPISPCSEKGLVRAGLLDLLAKGHANGLDYTVARSADFYGPNAKTSVFTSMVTNNVAVGKAPVWMRGRAHRSAGGLRQATDQEWRSAPCQAHLV